MYGKYLSFILLSAAFCLAAHAANPGVGETDGYRLVWQDEFQGSQLNRARWNVEVNGDGGGNNELQYYCDRPENVAVGDDGKGNSCLILTARRENYNGKNFTSGRINSRNKITFTHGKIEAAIKLPKTANGLWPAFWMMGDDIGQVGWPRCGEIDIMEFGNVNGINAGTQDRYFNGACHWGTSWPDACYSRDCTKNYSLQDGEFHIFTCVWTPDDVAMYVDLDKYPNQEPYYIMTITDNAPGDVWYPGNYFHKPNHILFNLAVGGGFPNIYDAAGITALNNANGQKASMYVDYVRIYQRGTPDEASSFADPGDPVGGPDDPFDSGLAEATDDYDIIVGNNDITIAHNGDIEVFDLAGRRCLATKGNSLSIDALPAGIYVVRATVAGKNATAFRKFCK